MIATLRPVAAIIPHATRLISGGDGGTGESGESGESGSVAWPSSGTTVLPSGKATAIGVISAPIHHGYSKVKAAQGHAGERQAGTNH